MAPPSLVVIMVTITVVPIVLPLLAAIPMRESGFVCLPVGVVLPLTVLVLVVLPVLPSLLEVRSIAIHTVVAITIAIMVAVLQCRDSAERRSGNANSYEQVLECRFQSEQSFLFDPPADSMNA